MSPLPHSRGVHVVGISVGVTLLTGAHYFHNSMALTCRAKMPPLHKIFIFTFLSMGTVQIYNLKDAITTLAKYLDPLIKILQLNHF